MVAVPEHVLPSPVTMIGGVGAISPVHERRAVAVAVSAMELLRPESDLARLLESFDVVDLLIATEGNAPCVPAALGVLDRRACTIAPVEDGDDVGSAAAADDDDADDDGVPADLVALGHPDVALHRLGLRAPWATGAEDDLVAAMSELVGFDPEPGVYALAPAGGAMDPARAVVGRAAERIARAYGIPLLRYRCLELSVVDPTAR